MTVVGSQPDEVARRVEVGNKVRIVTKDGQNHVFKVTQMTSDAIGGEEVQVSYNDIARVEVKELDAWRSAVVVVGIGAVAFVALTVTLIAYCVPNGGRNSGLCGR